MTGITPYPVITIKPPFIMLTAIFLIVSTLSAVPVSGTVSVDTKNTSMVFDATPGESLKIVHYGTRTENPDDFERAGITPVEYCPTFGMVPDGAYAIAAVQHDGNTTFDLRVSGAMKEEWEGGEILRVISNDSFYPIEVCNVFKSYRDEDIIETWAEITNKGRHAITLTRCNSGILPLRSADLWTTTFHGGWAAECGICTEPLSRGTKVVRGDGGCRNSQASHAEAIISLDGKPSETHGRVIGAALCWGGDFTLEFNAGIGDFSTFSAGISVEATGGIPLGRGTAFRTPETAYCMSDSGIGELSRRFHRWGRRYRLHAGDRERKIILNSWEGIHLDISEQAVSDMMKDASGLGAELFVLDDGWFGGKYSRTEPDCALGDWTTDIAKLPNGLDALTCKAQEHGIGFGLWIEPEMTNSRSELFEKHPDWVLKAAHREPSYGRGGTQLVLDLCNPEVQDFAVNAVDGILRGNPGIEYLKWDCNMSFHERGSQYLKDQRLLVTEWWKGFSNVCDRIRGAWPELTLQLCAAGGGRVNWGVLPWFDEFWTSDNTDALQRIFIQWGTSMFFPAIASAAHVSAVPNKATQRSTSLKYRIDVAMSGRLGLELVPSEMTLDELKQCRRAIAEYKEIRPVVQLGDLYRLVSPYDGKGIASLLYATSEKDRAVFFWWRLANFQGVSLPRVRLQGLDPTATYRISEINRYTSEPPLPFEGSTFSGRFLMDTGLELPPKHFQVPASIRGEWSSRVLLIEKIR